MLPHQQLDATHSKTNPLGGSSMSTYFYKTGEHRV